MLFAVKNKEYHQQVPLRGNLGVIKQAYGEHKNSSTLDKKTKILNIFEGKHALIYSEGFLPSLKELVMTIHICICIFWHFASLPNRTKAFSIFTVQYSANVYFTHNIPYKHKQFPRHPLKPRKCQILQKMPYTGKEINF